MKCLRSIATTSIVALTITLLSVTPTHAWPPGGNGRGGGNGGGGGGNTGPFNPAWVLVNDGQLMLMASNGIDTQEVGKGAAFRRLSAAAWSPDGNWIAYIKDSDILVVRPDGSNNRLIATFNTDDDRLPISSHGLQWVPGEVDRIIYRGRDADTYVLSTLAPGPPMPLGVLSVSATLSPDFAPQIPGFQGALAFSDWFARDIVVAYAEDGEFGLEVDLDSAVNSSTQGASLAWSHDGLEIAFVDGGYGEWFLDVLPVSVTPGGIALFDDEIRTLAFNRFAQGIDHIRWSPDDSVVAFIAQVGGEPSGESALDLFATYSDGLSPPINVTNGAGRPTQVDWNPLWTNDSP